MVYCSAVGTSVEQRLQKQLDAVTLGISVSLNHSHLYIRNPSNDLAVFLMCDCFQLYT